MKINITFIIITLIFLVSCSEETMAKKRGHVRLEYPNAKYLTFESTDTPYVFDYNETGTVNKNKKKENWYRIDYKKMKASIYLSYFPINNNLKSLLKDSEELLDTHTIKANSAKDSKFENPEQKTYGLVTRLGGETASNIQFYFTDSIKHYLSGSLYFHTQPQPDSLKPAIDYIEKDIKQLAKTLKWK